MRVKRNDKAKRSVSVNRLDDGSYVLRLFDNGEDGESYKETSLSSNNIDFILKDIKEFLEVSAPF